MGQHKEVLCARNELATLKSDDFKNDYGMFFVNIMWRMSEFVPNLKDFTFLIYINY